MGILDTVEYLNKNPLREDNGRHGTSAEEAEARAQLTEAAKKQNARTLQNRNVA